MSGIVSASLPARNATPLAVFFVMMLLAGLPVAVWMDLKALSEEILAQHAREVGRIINDVRGFYATEVVGRVNNAQGNKVVAAHNYRDLAGAIPIPATMSLELGRLISQHDGDLQYRFISDLPFAGREPHPMDGFERDALARLRADPQANIIAFSGSVFDRTVRIATPVILAAACVNCHNTHPDSPKRDWRAGDVRGIQEITIAQPIRANIFAFRYLLVYFAFAALVGVWFILHERRASRLIQRANQELGAANDFLASISMKIAKYLSPQVYKSIFSGQKEATIATERKKLTVFFSDIKDFTETAERLQPEELTALLNEYLTAMSDIALAHGATLDKFIGDAILCFFGDPETKGVEEDARACVRMAAAMKAKLLDLNVTWRKRGVENPFQVRMGINTGYCNVGNFGSEDRMDYTIIGAEANLAARLQYIAEPGQVVMSYETFALAGNLVHAHALPAIEMKGIARPVVPYAVDEFADEPERARTLHEQAPGLDLHIDLDRLDVAAARRARDMIERALRGLDAKPSAAG